MAIAYSVSTNIATVTAYTEAVPANFTDIYNADKAGTLSLHARTGIAGTDGAGVAVDRAERPADYIVLGSASNDLYITIANWNGTTATIRITGTDRDGAAQTEDIVVNANGTYYTTKWFKTITHTQVTAFTATSFDYDLTQGQWGVVWKQCTHKFCFDASIQFGDGSTTTWFKDTNKQILMKTGDITMYSTYKTSMYVKPLANVYFGEVQDATNKIGKNGCIVYYNYTDNYRKFGINVFGSGNLYLYASKFYGNQPYGFGSQYSSPAHTGNFTAWDCVFNKRTLTNSPSCDLNNVTVNLQNTVDVGVMCGGGTSNRINVFGVTTQGVLYPYGGDMTVRDAYIRDCANIALVSSSSGGDLYIIDADTDVWTIYWHNLNSYKVYRQYSFNLKVIDKDNVAINAATVKVWDKDSTLIVNTTTNASGVITEQIITRGYYDYTNNDVLQEKTPHEMRIYKYGKEMLSSKSSIEAKVDWSLTVYTDDHITQTTEATVAAYTGITINHTAETITISENHTLDEIYDYCQYDIIAATKQLDQTMHTADGVNFVSEYSFVVNTGITVTATDQKLSTVSGETYTLTGTAQFTGIIATTTTTRIPVKLTNIVDGSRYWVGKESDGSKIFDGTQSGSGTVTGYYEHTANINIDIRVRKSSASVKYQPWVGEGTLIADAFSLRIRQIQDSIIT